MTALSHSLTFAPSIEVYGVRKRVIHSRQEKDRQDTEKERKKKERKKERKITGNFGATFTHFCTDFSHPAIVLMSLAYH